METNDDDEIVTEVCPTCGTVSPAGWCGVCHKPIPARAPVSIRRQSGEPVESRAVALPQTELVPVVGGGEETRCLTCGFIAHAPSDVEYLLGRLHEQAQEIRRLEHEAEGTARANNDRIFALLSRAEAAESALAAAKQEIADAKAELGPALGDDSILGLREMAAQVVSGGWRAQK